MVEPKVFAIVGKGLIDRNISPAFGGYQITKPVVCQLMGDDWFPIILVIEGISALVSTLGMAHGSGILHSTSDKVTDNHLCVFCPWIVIAETLREESQHLGSITENSLGKGFVFLLYIVFHRHSSTPRGILDYGKFARSHKEKIRGMRLIHYPMVGA